MGGRFLYFSSVFVKLSASTVVRSLKKGAAISGLKRTVYMRDNISESVIVNELEDSQDV